MVGLYILLGIVLFFALVLSLRARIRITLDERFTLRAGLGPVMLTIIPKKEKKQGRKPPKLSDFSYKKHLKRLEKDRRAEEKKSAKERAKQEKKLAKKAKSIADKASETAERKKSVVDKLSDVFALVRFILNELSRLASYIHTDVRRLSITVGSPDAAKTAEIYGAVSAASFALLELLGAKTAMKPMLDGAVAVKADFLACEMSVSLDIRMSVSIFSVVRVGFHALGWFIGQKLRAAQE